jgi:hypothetical protein
MGTRKFDIPPLEGYTSLPAARVTLRVTRQRIYQMGVDEGIFATIRSIPGAGDRPAAYVVQNAEVLWHRKFQCAECKALTADGIKVLYCTHTSLDVPAWQAAAWKEHLEHLEQAEALRVKGQEPVTAGA